MTMNVEQEARNRPGAAESASIQRHTTGAEASPSGHIRYCYHQALVNPNLLRRAPGTLGNKLWYLQIIRSPYLEVSCE